MSGSTPVLISIGQFTNHSIDVADFKSPADLAAIAVKQCVESLSASQQQQIDSVLCCRTFSDSVPFYKAPSGGSNNLPRSIANRAGLNPATAIYAEPGGQSSQRLINEQCERIFKGESQAGLVVGVEAIRTTKLAAKQGVELNWHEEVEGQLDNREAAKEANGYEYAHGIGTPIQTYSLFEHALRREHGRSTAQHQRAMGELFAPFTKVAEANEFAQFPTARSAEELATVAGKNYALTDIYPKHMVAQDAVDQSGAVLIVADSLADEWGIPAEQRVYLHGYSCLADTIITERPNLGESRAMQLAGERALSASGKSIADIDFFDIYSCFPSAVFCAQKALGLEDVDPGKLTLTGGLPFFGGAGNSYSIHGVIEMVKTLRQSPGSFGLVLANGGYMSKEAVGIYSSQRPYNWQPVDSSDLQAEIDNAPKPAIAKSVNGAATISNFTVVFAKGAPKFAYILGETEQGERCLAVAAKGDSDTMNSLLDGDPVGKVVQVRNDSEARKNYFAFS